MTFDLFIADLALTANTPPSKWYFLLKWGALTGMRMKSLEANL